MLQGWKGVANDMAADLHTYWFAAAVFRDPRDLAATVRELRAGNLAERQFLVLANHQITDTRHVLDREGRTDVTVVPVSESGGVDVAGVGALPAGLTALLQALDAGRAPRERINGAVPAASDEPTSPVYAQMRRDVSDGSLVLIANVAGPEEQLMGARIMLRGRCECVLTHEMTAAPT